MHATETHGSVLAGGGVTLLARVADADGALVLPADVATATYTVTGREACAAPEGETPVAGHDGVALTPSAVLNAGLLVGGAWDVDDVGFNFRHRLDAAASSPFANRGWEYRVRYRLVTVAGRAIDFRFVVRAV